MKRRSHKEHRLARGDDGEFEPNLLDFRGQVKGKGGGPYFGDPWLDYEDKVF